MNNLTLVELHEETPQFTLTLYKDNDYGGDRFELRINQDHTVEIEGVLEPIEHARQLAQYMQMTFTIQNSEDKYDGFEMYRNKLIRRAKEMNVKQDFVDMLESDLFYYYLSGKEFDEE